MTLTLILKNLPGRSGRGFLFGSGVRRKGSVKRSGRIWAVWTDFRRGDLWRCVHIVQWRRTSWEGVKVAEVEKERKPVKLSDRYSFKKDGKVEVSYKGLIRIKP